MKTILLALSSLLVLGSPANLLMASDLYVSEDGNDTIGDGSIGNPFRSITAAMAVAQYGDVIQVAPGVYREARGETFPIFLRDGVAVHGPGGKGGEATLVCQRTKNMFYAAAAVDWTIEGMQLDNTNPAQGTLRPMIVGSRVSGAVIRNNTMLVSRGAIALASVAISLSGNTFIEDSGSVVIDMIALNAGPTAVVQNNTVLGGQVGISMGVGSNGQPITAEIVGNVIEDPSVVGIHINAAEAYVPALFDLTIERNTILGSGDRGLTLDWATSGTASAAATIRFNSIRSATGSGMELSMDLVSVGSSSGCGPGVLDLQARVEGNHWKDCLGNSLNVSSREDFCMSLNGSTPPDLGNGSPGFLYGRNRFENSGVSALDTYADGTFGTLPAQGNWWGTTSSSAIEAIVRHFPDTNRGWTVDYSQPLDGALSFTAVPDVMRQAGGETVTLTAGSGSAFVQQIGQIKLEAELSGVAVLDPTVSEDGTQLSFIAPPTAVRGPVLLTVTNPNGIVGSAVVTVKGNGGPWMIKGPLAPR